MPQVVCLLLEATTIPTQPKKNLPESALSVEDSKEPKAGSKHNIDLDSLQTRVLDIQLKVAELAAISQNHPGQVYYETVTL
jgi:hypothetical protein